ncbi:helix-turn-helix transcriptional regulator [Clostridium sp.]|uniref:helix-turn-helix domain-containing protein n=1 Tax=Clostridium sp. TaxID=1506 RepID=UPI00262A6D70|nr:helix-turn-helix transcriptional regulator [Clostridium sp.]
MEGKWKQAGEKLKEIRKKTNLSVFKVAKKTHISGSYLSMLERGINCPSDTVLFNLAEFYEVNPADLFKLYDRVVPPTNEQLNAVPSLKKIITEISIDSKLSAAEKEAFAKQLYKIANDIITKE